MNAKQNASQNVEANLPKVSSHFPKREITRQFVGIESLNEILVSVFEIQVDKLVESIYDTTRVNAVTSHTNQSEGSELL